MQPSYTIEELAELVNGQIHGHSSEKFTGLAPLNKADKNQISFISNRKYTHFLEKTNAGVVLITKDMAKKYSKVALIVANPYLAYAKLTHYFDSSFKPAAGIAQSAQIDSSVDLGENVYIGANVVIEKGAKIGDNCKIYPQTYIGADCCIGDNTIIYAQVVLYHETQIGKNCIIHSHAVLGADGFGFAPSANGWQKIAQLGKVIIGDKVEIGAGTTIDRGALQNTCIATDVKIDNLVQIAHGVEIGERTAIAGCAAIAGSTKIGKNCLIGGGTGIAGHIKIADGVQLAGMSGVDNSITEAGSYASQIPAFSIADWAKSVIRFRSLDKLFKRVKKIEETLEQNKYLQKQKQK